MQGAFEEAAGFRQDASDCERGSVVEDTMHGVVRVVVAAQQIAYECDGFSEALKEFLVADACFLGAFLLVLGQFALGMG